MHTYTSREYMRTNNPRQMPFNQLIYTHNSLYSQHTLYAHPDAHNSIHLNREHERTGYIYKPANKNPKLESAKTLCCMPYSLRGPTTPVPTPPGSRHISLSCSMQKKKERISIKERRSSICTNPKSSPQIQKITPTFPSHTVSALRQGPSPSPSPSPDLRWAKSP